LIWEQSAKIKFGKAMYTLLMRSELTAVRGKMCQGSLERKCGEEEGNSALQMYVIPL